jgi:hypothetical protein
MSMRLHAYADQLAANRGPSWLDPPETRTGRRRRAGPAWGASVRRGSDGLIGVNLASLALVLAAPMVFRAFAPLVDEPRGSFISFMTARLGVLVATTLLLARMGGCPTAHGS